MLVLPNFFFTIFRPLVRINAVAQGHESSVHGGTIQRLEKDDSSRYVESYRGRAGVTTDNNFYYLILAKVTFPTMER